MKFLENTKLEALCSALSPETGDFKLETRVESYSCKMVQSDKRQWKEYVQASGGSPNEPQPLSPPAVGDPWVLTPNGNSPRVVAPVGDLDGASAAHRSRSISGGSDSLAVGTEPVLCDAISRRLLFDLVAALNTSFPDYNFDDAKGEDFRSVPTLAEAMRQVDTQFRSVLPGYARMRHNVWALIDEEIKLAECHVYTYKPDYTSDPFSEDGCLWSINYLFYNKKLKRILFLACRALSLCAVNDSSSSGLWSMDET